MNSSSVFYFAFIAFISLTFSVNGQNKWVLKVSTAPDWMAGYVGDVTVCLTYTQTMAIPEEDLSRMNTTNITVTPAVMRREECKTLPNRQFTRGKTYLFELDQLHEVVDTLEKIKIFGKPSSTSVCKRKGYLDSWHVNSFSLHDMVTGRLYVVQQPLIIEPRCSAERELVIDTFNVSIQPRPCVMDGVIYESGERFNDGCSGSCRCENGGFSCVSMCPPSIAEGCRQVYVPGQCCQQHICENTPFNKFRSCPVYEEGDCEMANRTVSPGQYPWTVFIKLCDKKGCRKSCSGALIDHQWVLTAAECVRAVSNVTTDLRVIVGENTVVFEEDSEVEIHVESVAFSNTKHPAEQIALIKLREPVAFDQSVQPATLPISRDQCLGVTRPRCATTMTGWVNVNADIQQYEQYQLSVNLLDRNECEPSSINIGNRKRKPIPPSATRGLCLDLSKDEVSNGPECGICNSYDDNSTGICQNDKNWYLCSGEKGRMLMSKMMVPSGGAGLLEVNYLVGVVTYQMNAGETSMDLCRKPAYKMAVNICNDLDWISETTRNSYYYN